VKRDVFIRDYTTDTTLFNFGKAVTIRIGDAYLETEYYLSSFQDFEEVIKFPGFHPGLMTIALPGLRIGCHRYVEHPRTCSALEGRQLLAQGKTLGMTDH
jgi:hypothetical protein